MSSVLFFSIGGIGVIMNIDRVATMMATAGSSCKVRGISDSGWYLESKPDLTQCKNNPQNCNKPAQAIKKGMGYVFCILYHYQTSTFSIKCLVR